VPARFSANPSLIEHRALAVGVYHGLEDHNSDGSTSAATGYHRAKARQIPLGDRTPDLAARIHAIDDGLETIAREVIVHHLDISRPENASFLASPDARDWRPGSCSDRLTSASPVTLVQLLGHLQSCRRCVAEKETDCRYR